MEGEQTNDPQSNNQIIKLVYALKKKKKFKDLQVGGTKGTINRFIHSDKVKNYASKWFKNENKYQQRSTSRIEQDKAKETEMTKDEEWKTPPSPR